MDPAIFQYIYGRCELNNCAYWYRALPQFISKALNHGTC